eukprot:TRINITY_DN19525_c0_g1_i3.p1 TRINITY_DN19525_c0_g1~~TRINITY_DN19525_c0_g1_i3.p1  ORF type:complete len:587 (+),score=93.73 TRINITY_DN19525_c0_g1_i3:45-1805(+)
MTVESSKAMAAAVDDLPSDCDSSICSDWESDVDEETTTSCAVVLRLSLFACASGALFGVDLGSIGSALAGMTEELELTTEGKELVVSSTKGGAVFGCLLGGALMASKGRRTTVAWSCLPFLVGPLLVGSASSMGQIVCGRLLMGVGVGLASVAAPCYLSEVAPPMIRGSLVATYEVAIALGFFFASIVNYVIEAHMDVPWGDSWRYQAGLVPFLAAGPLLLAVLMVPESPRWLLSRAGGDADRLHAALLAIQRLDRAGAAERLEVVRRIGGEKEGAAVDEAAVPWSAPHDDLLALWDLRHKTAGSPLLLDEAGRKKRPQHLAAAEPRIRTWRVLHDMLTDICTVMCGSSGVPPGARWGLVIALLGAALDQLCASTSILTYAQTVLQDEGVTERTEQDKLTIGVAAAKVVGTMLGLLVVNRLGRRPLLAWGGMLTGVATIVIALGSAGDDLPLLVGGMCAYMIVFMATWGNGYWVVVTEVTVVGGPRFTPAMQAASTATLFLTGSLAGLTFVSVKELGAWALLSYAGVAVCMAVYAIFILPETRGCTLEDCVKRVQHSPIQVCAGLNEKHEGDAPKKLDEESGSDVQ